MSEYKEVKKRGGTAAVVKYPEQHQKLIEMGFDTAKVVDALTTSNGNLEAATAILLGEPNDSNSSRGVAGATKPAAAPMKTVGKPASTSSVPVKAAPVKQDIREVHNKFMAMYKIVKCKEKNNHDKRNCVYWHSRGDRRRNPFEIPYTCLECPNSSDTQVCPEGDNCMKAHNMLERMFHPELFKISMCQRGPTLDKCDRGPLCAFAHSEEDHRIPLSQMLAKQAAASTAAAPSSPTATSAQDPMHSRAMPLDSKHLDDLQERLLTLIKSQGAEGIISSELPKRYADAHHERLELTDETGERFRIKDLLLQHPCIQVQMHKGVQPKYVWVEVPGFKAAAPSSLLAASNSNSNSNSNGSAGVAPITYASLASGATSWSNVAASSSAAKTNLAVAPAAPLVPPVPGTPPKVSNTSTVSPAVAVSLPTSDSTRVRRRPETAEASSVLLGGDFLSTAPTTAAASAVGGGRRRGPEVDAASIGVNADSFSLASLGLSDGKSREVELLESQLHTMKSQFDELQSLRNEYTLCSQHLQSVTLQLQQMKQERTNDLVQFRHNISQIESALVEAQQQEARNIKEFPLHDTLVKSSRARDDLTQFVSILKSQLTAKIGLVDASAVNAGVGSTISKNNNNNSSNSNSSSSFLNSSPAKAQEEATASGYRNNSDVLMCSLPGCKLEGSFICSACGKAQYCGADHQREHWAQHINECTL